MTEAIRVRFPIKSILDVDAYFRKLGATPNIRQKPTNLQFKQRVPSMKMMKPSEEISDEMLNSTDCYCRAVQRLKAAPTQMLYRKKQLQQIYEFITMRSPSSMCRILNISGVPGVGKRTAVKLCVKKAKLYRNLIHAEVAISKNWSLSCLYNQILKKLEVCALNINEESQLDRLFRSNEPFPCDGIVLVISSADMLTNNQQAFLMKIMGWLSEAGDKLTVVFTSAGVGFSINLKNGYDGLLVDEVIFPAYNAEQLEHIVKGKLDSDQHLFQEGTIKQICRRATGKSSDVGLLFKLCEDVLLCAKSNYHEESIYSLKDNQIVVAEVRHLMRTIEPNWLPMVFACSPRIQQLALVAICHLIKNNPMVECNREVERLLAKMLNESCLEYEVTDLMMILLSLSKKKLIIVDDWSNHLRFVTDSSRLVLHGVAVQPSLSMQSGVGDPLIDHFLHALN